MLNIVGVPHIRSHCGSIDSLATSKSDTKYFLTLVNVLSHLCVGEGVVETTQRVFSTQYKARAGNGFFTCTLAWYVVFWLKTVAFPGKQNTLDVEM